MLVGTRKATLRDDFVLCVIERRYMSGEIGEPANTPLRKSATGCAPVRTAPRGMTSYSG
jgi:hypothetical protein